MEKSINFRYFKLKDIPIFNKILTDIWRLGRCQQMSKIGSAVAGLLYILSILEESEQIIVATNNNKTIGFCGYGMGKSKKIYYLLYETLLRLIPSKDRKIYRKYYQDYSYGNLHPSSVNAEISILIISPQYYGKGLGKNLVKMLEKEVAKKGCHTIYALSDSGCHWSFYEKIGYKRVFEQNGPKLKSEKQYVFQKNFKCKNS